MRYLLFALLLLPSVSWSARFDCNITPPPLEQQDRLVWQYADLLSDQEAERLDAKLTRFAQETSNRILVIVVDTLCGYPESDLAFEIGERWGIGKKGFDNGLVVLIKPNGPPGQRKVFIATGYGLEGAIPDLRAKQVVEGFIIPRFKAGNYFEGLDEATNALMAMAKGEFNEKSLDKRSKPWPLLVIILLFGLIMFFSWRSRVRNYAATNDIDFWTAMWLLGQMDRRHAGRWHGGGGSFGGGGGFGGFGGGSFGGGGAGGSW